MFGLTPYEQRRNPLTARRPRDIFDYFFNDDFSPAFSGGFSTFKADIIEHGNEYVIEAEMPGLGKEDLKIDLQDDIMTISAEKKDEKNEEKGSYIRRERHYGSYSRSFRVDNIKQDSINAKFENGILKITLPKQNETVERKQSIDIN
jgi:HSP20 family protein